VIRLFIRIAEYVVARPKHRRLRRRMAQAKSYPEWFAAASELDRSQKRDRWLRQMDDHTCKRYNWGFIRELINDMKRARAKDDPILALAVLQQCTRKVNTLFWTDSWCRRMANYFLTSGLFCFPTHVRTSVVS
jgi:hypothetical protein